MKREFAVALLVGGRSLRMGVDKAYLIDPVSGLESWMRQMHVLEELEPQERFLSIREGQAQPDGCLAWRSVTDAIPDAGPLAGIAACLHATEQPFVLMLGIDLLSMRAEALKPLLEMGSGAVYVNAQGLYEPLAAVYPKEAMASAFEFLASGERRLQDWISQGIRAGWMHAVPLPRERAVDFLNVNTREDYERLTLL